MKLSFRLKLFLWLSLIFTVFTLLILLFQYDREKKYRVSQLESTLDNISELARNYIEGNYLMETGNFRKLDSLVEIVPVPNIRLTIIDPRGKVLYDSEVAAYEQMENHLDRPEVRESIAKGSGSYIRQSATTGHTYYYYAKANPSYFVRTAALYDVRVENFLHVEKFFIFYLVLLFLVTFVALLFITRRISRTIAGLRDFTRSLSNGQDNGASIEFSRDELGSIAGQITYLYRELDEARNKILVEKNKLYSHLNAVNEGVAFFSAERETLLANNHFIQHLNLIANKSTNSSEDIFNLPEMAPINGFINRQLNVSSKIGIDDLPQEEMDLTKGNRYFNVKCFFFQDKTFEIVITDTSKLEKRKLMKQQMTSNIAHELKTPIATVLGYLETLQHKDIDPKMQDHFIGKAHAQAKRLSDLVEDISTLNRIEEAGEKFTFESVNIIKVVEEVLEHMNFKLEEQKIKVHVDLPKKLFVKGNRSLLASVFHNLFDNAIKYGGEGIQIYMSKYLEDKKYYYFSFANTGSDIEEKHLARIFERFYRIDDGRSRKTGGTGLGLAIVKNAIQLHGGEISATKYKDQGVEFLFTLCK